MAQLVSAPVVDHDREREDRHADDVAVRMGVHACVRVRVGAQGRARSLLEDGRGGDVIGKFVVQIDTAGVGVGVGADAAAQLEGLSRPTGNAHDQRGYRRDYEAVVHARVPADD